MTLRAILLLTPTLTQMACTTTGSLSAFDFSAAVGTGNLLAPVYLPAMDDGGDLELAPDSKIKPQIAGNQTLNWSSACSVRVSADGIQTPDGTFRWDEIERVEVRNQEDGATVAAVIGAFAAIAVVSTAAVMIHRANASKRKARHANSRVARRRRQYRGPPPAVRLVLNTATVVDSALELAATSTLSDEGSFVPVNQHHPRPQPASDQKFQPLFAPELCRR